MDTRARIRELNDAFRTSFAGGKIMLTVGVNALTHVDRVAVLNKVRQFSDFNGDNDPHGEHDFVSVEHGGTKYFAKMDYYAPGMEAGSEDPADPQKTVRVLTIMEASEY